MRQSRSLCLLSLHWATAEDPRLIMITTKTLNTRTDWCFTMVPSWFLERFVFSTSTSESCEKCPNFRLNVKNRMTCWHHAINGQFPTFITKWGQYSGDFTKTFLFTREKHIKEPLLNHHPNVRVVNKIFWWYIFYIRDTAACLLPSMYCKTSLFYWEFGLAAKTNASQKQWIELGDLSRYSCIVKPSLCGATGGGSISVWIRTQCCSDGGGILTSLGTS